MVLFQKPNKELIFAACGFAASFFTKGTLHLCALIVFTIFASIWAFQEITTGVNWFRKLLGVLALIFTTLFVIFTVFIKH